MPCDSSHLKATGLEVEVSKLYALLDEINLGVKPDGTYGSGYDKRAYGSATREIADDLTEQLCRKLTVLTDSQRKRYSLEMQIWWRDHQKADAVKAEQDLKRIWNTKLKKQALAKLTPEEKKALGL